MNAFQSFKKQNILSIVLKTFFKRSEKSPFVAKLKIFEKKKITWLTQSYQKPIVHMLENHLNYKQNQLQLMVMKWTKIEKNWKNIYVNFVKLRKFKKNFKTFQLIFIALEFLLTENNRINLTSFVWKRLYMKFFHKSFFDVFFFFSNQIFLTSRVRWLNLFHWAISNWIY